VRPQQLAHKRHCRVAGLITNRQRPGTASGVVFLTLEDETGNCNLVVWPRVLERYRAEVLQGRLLLVSGHMERQGRVCHLIVDRMQDRGDLIARLPTRSRDFH
jgi:error-prone DNA polymerase